MIRITCIHGNRFKVLLKGAFTAVLLQCLVTHFICLSFLPLVALAEHDVNWGQGPIEIEDQYFFSMLHLGSRPMSPEIIKEGENQFKATGAWSNTAAHKTNDYFVDLESHVGYFDYRRGIAENWELGIRLPLIWRGGGDHDSDINSVHDFFGLPDGSRNDMKSDRYSISGARRDGTSFEFDEQGTELGNIKLESRYLVSKGDQSTPAFTLQATASLPTAANTYGHENLDFLLGGLLSKKWSSFVGYAGASMIYYSNPDIAGIDYARIHPEGFAALEYVWTEDLSLELGIFGHAFEKAGFRNHPDYAIYLDIGIKYLLSKNLGLEILMRQNPSPSSGTADVTALAGLTLRP